MSAEIILSISGLFDSDEYFEVPFSAFTTDKLGPYLYFVATQQPSRTDSQNANTETVNKDTPSYSKSTNQEQSAIAEKHYIEIVELKPETAIIKFKQQPDINQLVEARIVKTGVDFIRPNQAISVVETSTQIYNQ
jgi:hypothetical protein